MVPLAAPTVTSLSLPPTQDLALEELAEARIERLMVLLFKDGLNEDQWARVFRGANELSSLQKQRDQTTNSELQAQSDDAIMNLLSGELLDSVAHATLWNSSRFDCRLKRVQSDANEPALKLYCSEDGRPEDFLPQAPTLGLWQNRPAETASKIFLPFLSILASYQGDYGNFEMELQLRPEPLKTLSAGQILLKGDILLSDGAVILEEPFGKNLPAFKYGYAEILLITRDHIPAPTPAPSIDFPVGVPPGDWPF